MKHRITRIAIGAVIATLMLSGCGRETQQKLVETQQQLAVATNEIAAARAELAEVRTQMETQVSELKQTVAKLTDEKTAAENQATSLKGELENTQKQSEQDKANLTDQVKQVSDRLDEVNRKLAELEHTHATTVTHLQAMRAEYVKLTNEKDELEATLHDLHALNRQVRLVKQEIHARKVEERERLDRAEFAMGNHGYLLKGGSWVTPAVPGKYPLTQEMHFAE